MEYYYDFNGIWISSTYDKKCLQLLIKDDFVEIPESEAALLLWKAKLDFSRKNILIMNKNIFIFGKFVIKLS